ncbi:MAG TPA: hypothetical protein VGI39_17980 [Polyangiaceae bacterium]|jgi:hypothetical protein
MSVSMAEAFEADQKKLDAEREALRRYPDLRFGRLPGHSYPVFMSVQAIDDCDRIEIVCDKNGTAYLAPCLLIEECLGVFGVGETMGPPRADGVLAQMAKKTPKAFEAFTRLVKKAAQR